MTPGSSQVYPWFFCCLSTEREALIFFAAAQWNDAFLSWYFFIERISKKYTMKFFRGNKNCRIRNPDTPRAGRVGAHGGVASGTGCQQNGSPRRQASHVPSKASKTRRLNVSPEARTSEFLCKPMEEQKPAQDRRFIRGSSAVWQRDEKRSLFLAADQWTDAFFVSVNPFHAKHVRKRATTKRILRNTLGSKTWTSTIGTVRPTAQCWGGARCEGTSTARPTQKTPGPCDIQGILENYFERNRPNTNKGNKLKEIVPDGYVHQLQTKKPKHIHGFKQLMFNRSGFAQKQMWLCEANDSCL